MEGVVGVFRSSSDAAHAVNDLRRLGQPEDSIVFLTADSSNAQLAEVPTTNAEGPGIGKAISTVVGGALGGGAGLGLGSAIASLFVPGIGPIVAAGIGAAALLGAGGAAAGAKLGEESEEHLDTGIPIDEVPRLHYLLKSGRTLVVVSVDSKEKEEQVRALFNSFDAEPFHHCWDLDCAA